MKIPISMLKMRRKIKGIGINEYEAQRNLDDKEE